MQRCSELQAEDLGNIEAPVRQNVLEVGTIWENVYDVQFCQSDPMEDVLAHTARFQAPGMWWWVVNRHCKLAHQRAGWGIRKGYAGSPCLHERTWCIEV